MKTLLVTGGAGFIGSNFILHMLKRRDIRVINLDKLTYAGNLENLQSVKDDPLYTFIRMDICDREGIKGLFQSRDISYVVNFAAESHVDRSITEPDIFMRTNVSGAFNLISAANDAWEKDNGLYREGCKFIQISTDEVYGALGPGDAPFTEKTPLDPHSPYSASKASADLIVKAWADTYGIPVNITRCSNNYGPFQFPEKLIPLIIHNALKHMELPVYGDGMQIRDWIHVDDHCRAVELVLFDGKPGGIYNIGGDSERANLSVVRSILSHLQIHADPDINEGLIRHVEDRKGHDRRYGVNAGKIKKELGWKPEIPFESGLADTIDWYLKNGGWIKRVINESYQSYYDAMYSKRKSHDI